jgi:C1A family cysteine protease
MLAVGWGAEKKSITHFKKTPYLLLKNSFGKTWGVDGFVKVEIDSSKIGVAGMYKEIHYPFG